MHCICKEFRHILGDEGGTMSSFVAFLRVTAVNIFICFSLSSSLNRYRFVVSRCLLARVRSVLLGSFNTILTAVCMERITKFYSTL